MGKVTLPTGFNPKHSKYWYLVANRAEAIVYEGNLNGSFQYRKRLKNSAGKLKESQLEDSRPGRVFSSSRSGARHGFSPRVPAQDQVAIDFARRIASMLEKAALREEYSDLVVVAEPRFLGFVNRELPKTVKSVIRREVPKEWKRGSDEDLAEFLRAKLH